MPRKLIVIGASAGGIEALKKLLAELPSDLPAAVLVVLHIPPHSTSVLPSVLSRAGSLEAVHPNQGEILQSGRIYVAPPNHHLLIKLGKLHLARGPKENGHRPAIDVLFRSAAQAYGPAVVGVVLSGLLDDGTAGLLAIKQQGGIAIVQKPDEALYPSMPLSAIENVEIDQILPASEIGATLVRLADEPVSEKDQVVSNDQKIELEMAELVPEAMHQEARPGTPSVFSCPECSGVLWELKDNNLSRFRCRTGHAFSAESLLAQQSESIEVALWTALRALEETAALRHRMEKRADKLGHTARAQRYREQAQVAKQRAELLRQALLNTSNPEDESANHQVKSDEYSTRGNWEEGTSNSSL